MSATNNRKGLTTPCFACLLVIILAVPSCFGRPINGFQNQGIPPTQRVTFVLRDHANAKTVALAGTFNNWDMQKTPMTQFIHHDEPELVVSSIREVVNATRRQK